MYLIQLCFEFYQSVQKQSFTDFCKVGVLIDFAKFTGKHLYQSLFFNHLEASRLQIVKKIIKKETSYGLCGVFTNTFYRVHPLVHPLQSTASVSANLYFLLSHISHISHIYIYIKYIYIYITYHIYITYIYTFVMFYYHCKLYSHKTIQTQILDSRKIAGTNV